MRVIVIYNVLQQFILYILFHCYCSFFAIQYSEHVCIQTT